MYFCGRGCHEFFVTRSAFFAQAARLWTAFAKTRFAQTLALCRRWRSSPCESAGYRHCKIVPASAAKLQKTDNLYTYKTKANMLLRIHKKQ